MSDATITAVKPSPCLELVSWTGVPLRNIVSQCREQASGVYYGAVFEIKKCILDVRLLL
jgi:hypothetical protein